MQNLSIDQLVSMKVHGPQRRHETFASALQNGRSGRLVAAFIVILFVRLASRGSCTPELPPMTGSIVQRLPGVLQPSSDIRRCWALPVCLLRWAAGTFARRNVRVDGGPIVGARFPYGKLPYRTAPFMVQTSTLTLWPFVNSSCALCLWFHQKSLTAAVSSRIY
jgi:hypothetical protein